MVKVQKIDEEITQQPQPKPEKKKVVKKKKKKSTVRRGYSCGIQITEAKRDRLLEFNLARHDPEYMAIQEIVWKHMSKSKKFTMKEMLEKMHPFARFRKETKDAIKKAKKEFE